jgi:hypothetical protein
VNLGSTTRHRTSRRLGPSVDATYRIGGSLEYEKTDLIDGSGLRFDGGATVFFH